MDNFMKVIAIFVMFVEIQTALSQPIIPPGGPNDVIQQLCKRNRYQSLCVSTLNLDPRSKTSSNPQELASISIDATTKKVNETQEYLISVIKTIRRREDWEMYGTCIEEYGAAIRRFLPATLADLKAKNYSQAMSNMKDVVSAPGICQDQFAGKCPFALTGRNKAVHDIADMTADIIKTFFVN
ncbi:hypothetical protein EUTSA_v10022234mg [Eutrema salsugineum]|uniref:Pectinesterase inhibitor domain-containing protein n=1 Tax=Eutrema salsugineum TaxID=72664 RepID=V4LWK5_EUTSA|nr:pectinesterase inhibitor 12 [Eutrema salsugineum]ESQ48214.1 hypothetical protein EUTSA_v10022234mg [Eutrema salsugineum]